MESEKIKSLGEIEKIVKSLKNANKEIVTCNGAFDILHIGHLKFLKEAKDQGDILIVGLNSDVSVRMNKGDNRPINNEKSRAEVLAALECVDYVVIFSEKDPRKILEVIKPDVHVNGEEYGQNCIEAKTVRDNLGKIYLVRRLGQFSTTNLINKIKEVYKE